MKGYIASIKCIGKGKTGDDAITALLSDLHLTRQHIEFDCSGEDCVKIEECEIDEEEE